MIPSAAADFVSTEHRNQFNPRALRVTNQAWRTLGFGLRKGPGVTHLVGQYPQLCAIREAFRKYNGVPEQDHPNLRECFMVENNTAGLTRVCPWQNKHLLRLN